MYEVENPNMKIPAYVLDILKRSKKMPEYMISSRNESEPFYTLVVRKEPVQEYASTFSAEMDRFVAWCNRVAPSDYRPTARVVRVPDRTRYSTQVALVEIFDPLMLTLEKIGLIRY